MQSTRRSGIFRQKTDKQSISSYARIERVALIGCVIATKWEELEIACSLNQMCNSLCTECICIEA